MDVAVALAEHFLCLEHEKLGAHTLMLSGRPRGDWLEYQLEGEPVQVHRNDALRIACYVRAERRRQDLLMAEILRCLAEEPPKLNEAGGRNLANWVGLKTRDWYTVFSYSSPDPGSPWFCQLDVQAQGLVLLLVAEILESQT